MTIGGTRQHYRATRSWAWWSKHYAMRAAHLHPGYKRIRPLDIRVGAGTNINAAL